MNNHLNMLPKQAKLDLKCSKMRWQRRSPNPLIVKDKPLPS